MDDEIVAAIQKRGGEKIDIKVNVFEVFCIIGNIELALRHPKNNGYSSEITKLICCRYIRELIKMCPELKEEKKVINMWSKSFGFKY
ncbi:hypothetical protein LCGC14_0817690 [marine sediment metagenome]|uniref:Uncharacterized protein n=1 Tax=marine sediment metagenome TaxID=412755 RepID=A0A0F9PJP5_9ZZZZ|nr:hypothetical protein [Desulfobacterales bacterium]